MSRIRVPFPWEDSDPLPEIPRAPAPVSFVALPDWADDRTKHSQRRDLVEFNAREAQRRGGDYDGAHRIYERVATRADKRNGGL